MSCDIDSEGRLTNREFMEKYAQDLDQFDPENTICDFPPPRHMMLDERQLKRSRRKQTGPKEKFKRGKAHHNYKAPLWGNDIKLTREA